jgi:uncharacterized protein YjeT (DUF2065 family)
MKKWIHVLVAALGLVLVGSWMYSARCPASAKRLLEEVTYSRK